MSACVRMEVLLEGRRTPGGRSLERRDRLRSGTGPAMGLCTAVPAARRGREGRALRDTDGDGRTKAASRSRNSTGARKSVGCPRGQAWEVSRPHPVTVRCSRQGLHPPRAQEGPRWRRLSLPKIGRTQYRCNRCSPARSRVTMRTRVSREKAVRSLSKGHRRGPTGASRSRPQV
jgi:hypothetical protein